MRPDTLLDTTTALLLRSSPHTALGIARASADGLDLRLWVAALEARVQATNDAVEACSTTARTEQAGAGSELARAVLRATRERRASLPVTLARVEASAVTQDMPLLSSALRAVAESGMAPSQQVDAYLAWRGWSMAGRGLMQPPSDLRVQTLVDARTRNDVVALVDALHAPPAGLAERLLRDYLEVAFDDGADPSQLLGCSAALLARSGTRSERDRRFHALQDVFPLTLVAEGLFAAADGGCPVGPTVLAAASALVRISEADLVGVADILLGPAAIVATAASAADALDSQLAAACRWVLVHSGDVHDDIHVGMQKQLARLVTERGDATAYSARTASELR